MPKKFLFDRTKVVVLPEPAIPLLFRVNKVDDPANLSPMHWGSYNPNNRFSTPGTSQCYLSSSLASITEATPWRQFFAGGGSRIPLSEKDLEGYYVSYIRPTFPLRLLDFVTEHEIYGATADIAHGSNLREAEDFSNQVQEHCDVDGIMYTSKYNEAGINAVLFQRCQNHFTDDSYIHTERLCETIRPMKEVLENRVGLKFLL